MAKIGYSSRSMKRKTFSENAFCLLFWALCAATLNRGVAHINVQNSPLYTSEFYASLICLIAVFVTIWMLSGAPNSPSKKPGPSR